MVPPARPGTFSPNPTVQTSSHGGINHSPHPSLSGALSAGASPSTSSPTGTSSLIKIVVAQVYLLLSTIKEDKEDPSKWDLHTEQLNKLIDDHGMEVFSKYFTRLVAANASQIFPGLNRPVVNPGNHHLLVAEMHKLSQDIDQARKIAESIETGTEDIFRDFDLSSFMEHFKLDALEKTMLALAFKMGTRSDLKTKADAILSTNFPTFVNILSRSDGDHKDMSPDFIAELVDRFVQLHPPNFNAAAKAELAYKVQARYPQLDQAPPSQVLAALDLVRVLGDKPPNALALYIHRTGAEFTIDEDTCSSLLQSRPPNIQLSEEQVSVALTYVTNSQTPRHNPSVLVRGLRRVLSPTFRWQDVVSYFDQRGARISSEQFLRLYNALLPIAQEESGSFDIQHLWGGNWENPETQLSFICAFASLSPDELDATTIPGLQPTFTLEAYDNSPPEIRQRAAVAVKHPLVSVAALSAVFHVALHSVHASQSIEAKRLFQEVVVPNLDIFVVSAFGVPKPWPSMAVDTLNSLFDNFLYKNSPEYDFVLDSLWRQDKDWVKQRLIDAHAVKPIDLRLMFEHAVKHGWLDELVYLPNGFGLDLTALAHAEGFLDLQQWARNNSERSSELARSLLQFLMIKSAQELSFQRPPEGQLATKTSTTLQVRTVSAMLQILEDYMPKTPVAELILLQRHCITAYPRLINYGEAFDIDKVIDANGKDGNALPQAANSKMEEHYKKMYGDEMAVRSIVEVLERYKHSRDPLDQDVFACMIHGLFDEYPHYVDYPLEALATTAVLFGGIISHKLISDLPLQIGLGMILEAVRDHRPEDSMYKFGLQALMQLFTRLREWPGFCKQLVQLPGLQGTEVWKKAEDVVREHEEEMARGRNGTGSIGSLLANETLTNGALEDSEELEPRSVPFVSIGIDPPPAGIFEDPDPDTQGKVQFVLNNLTETTLLAMFKDLQELLEEANQQWFAGHLVEERAKMQPNYHTVYLDLITKFEDKALWAEVLRETYISVSRMLNSEITMQNSTERTHLKNLGSWLGLLTLARDKPIKHKNIAFKQLLIEAHDTKRLIVVIPFVCKVLAQGVNSNVFRPPNPWLMDIIHFLIELYHNAELKLNLKFEIEVLCKGLDLDHKTIEPSGEILNRAAVEDIADLAAPDALEAFESLSMNGIASAVTGGISSQAVPPSIPDLGPQLQIPPTNEMVVSQHRLHEIVRTALTRALQDIIQPVVDRSVTIAAISTQQMIHKDFATEPDENRVRTSAINMVKQAAGHLALVTGKEPLRANFTNNMRSLSNDLPQGLPEGTIIMCVNSNLDLGSGVIERSAEERAVPEIEDLIEPELEARRRHRLQRPSEPYVDPSLSRWAWTIPNPYKLSPNVNGLNPEQMAIYEDFARQPRPPTTTTTPSHGPSASDATRSMANEILQDQFSSAPAPATPAEQPPSMPHIGSQLQQQQHYPPVPSALPNGRQQPGINHIDARLLAERVKNLLLELQRVCAEAREEHFSDLPRPHPVLDIIDALVQLIIKTQQTSEDFALYAAEQIAHTLFAHMEGSLATESFVHVLETLRKIAGPALSQRVSTLFHQQPGTLLLHLPLVAALLGTDLLDWKNIDSAMAKVLQQRKEGSLDFFEQLLDLTLLNDAPVAFYADFVNSLEAAWIWSAEEPSIPAGQRLRAKILGSETARPSSPAAEDVIRQDQMDYVFDEWLQLRSISSTANKAAPYFLQQLHARGVIVDRDDLFLFFRQAFDKCVERFDQNLHQRGSISDGYHATDSLAKLVGLFLQAPGAETPDGRSRRASFIDSVLALSVLVMNHYHVKRGDLFNQKPFLRFYSSLIFEINAISDDLSETEVSEIWLKFAARLLDLGPVLFPGFLYAWLALVQHRILVPAILRLPNEAGWAPFTKILRQLLLYLGDQLKPFEVTNAGKDIYRAVLKLLIILQHDFPDYITAHHLELCESIPPHCTQLLNIILLASPASAKVPDPMQPGLKVDRMPEIRQAPASADDPAGYLREIGLLAVVDHVLQNGPSEDAVAQIAHAINRTDGRFTAFGHVPINVDLRVIDALTAYIGGHAVAPVTSGSEPAFTSGSPDVKMLFMLVTELPPEARYYLLSSMVNQLRFPNAHTYFFSQALLEIFGHDLADPEQTEVRQQIARILLERIIGFWPHPWGLMITVVELIKNEKYMFFELPFIKADPDIAQRFAQFQQS